MGEIKEKDPHFDKIFWFIVGLCSFGAILTIFLIIYMPKPVSERIADAALIFWLSSAVGGGIGYLLGNSASKTKTNSIGATTLEANVSATTEPKTPEI